MDIPQTLQDIYLEVLKLKFYLEFDGNKIDVYPRKITWKDVFVNLAPKKSFVIRRHILRPTLSRMATGIPLDYKLESDTWRLKISGKGPRCKWAWCGRNIELGYAYCDEHRKLCHRCKKREPYMGINGERVCWYCIGRR